MGLTLAQQQAVAARGNVLVVAGAGTGKTSTLVERCIGCLLDEGRRASLEEILMVTFTEAAAADMRQRIRQRLERELEQAQAKDGAGTGLSGHWQEQLALFETAHIGTLHSFCFQLVRQHFYDLELDPQLSVLPEEETRLLAEETLDDVLQKHYAGTNENAEAVQKLIQTHGGGSDRPIRALVLRLHHYTQTLPDPAGWLTEQLQIFASPQPKLWQQWLERGLVEWQHHWRPILEHEFPGNQLAEACASVLKKLPGAPDQVDFATMLDGVLAAVKNCPHGKKSAWRDPIEEFVEEARFLFSLVGKTARKSTGQGKAPAMALMEDWTWVRGQMKTLLELAREFTTSFSDSKHELGVVDYHDLEQYALRLLWDRQTGQPTAVARQWREKLRFVFVDEYQDINAAQDRIIDALCREGADANRFLVGDVKQSIYRFRLANPRIFQNYIAAWGAPRRADQSPAGRTIPLVDNFRSREGVLQFINSVFGLVMQPELGGVAYDEQAQLRFGAPVERAALGLAADPSPCVELHLQLLGGAAVPNENDAELGEAFGELAEMERAGKEARMLALRLSELKARRHPVWDEETKTWRPVEWSDMAVLLRAPSNKADSYAREFSRLNVPLLVARAGFYDSLEISDLLNVLRLLDNPLQDLPLLAVLRSPLASFTLDELATIRLTSKGPFWNALVQWSEGPRDNNDLSRKTAAFLERYHRWRRLARQASLTRCLDTVLAETYYADWVLTQSRGEQRRANLQRLSGLVRQFDQFQRQGLFRFLRFIDAQQRTESEPVVPPVSGGDAVRLMSIHQSKGLEFPVVAVADLGKSFNLADLRADIILDEEYGLCPRITPPRTGRSYPSLAYWLARKRQTSELLGEELRLLYVAMTRARDTLLLSAGISESKFENLWKGGAAQTPSPRSARCYADWLGLWFARKIRPDDETSTHGQGNGLRWFVHSDARLAAAGPEPAPTETQNQPPNAADTDAWRKLQQRLSWTYPFAGATHKPAKTSVSTLRRLAAEYGDEEAKPLYGERPFPVAPFSSAAARHGRAPAAEVGNAHHTFLQFVDLEHTGTLQQLREEARRLADQGLLTSDQAKLLDFEALAAFWQSEIGRRVRAQARFVRRELPFTARFSPPELAALTGEPLAPHLEDEFIVVQGVADLAVLLPTEIWLVDFKTDAIDSAELPPKVKLYEPQVRLYGQALARIYNRPASESWLYFLSCSQAVKVGI